MDKLDRLVWADGVSIVIHGLRIGIRVSNGAYMDQVMQSLPPGWRPAKSPVVDQLYSLVVGVEDERKGVRRYNILYAGPVILARRMQLGETLETLTAGLKMYVAEWARGKLFIHAGVVGWQGRAIVMPGRSFSGKTSLVAALVKASATYYSDEYALLDANGQVHPYPVPLSIRENPDAPSKPVHVDELGGKQGVDPLPIGILLATQYRKGARWRPRDVSHGQAVLTLLANTVAARRKPQGVLSKISPIVANVRRIKSLRGDADEVARSLLGSLANDSKVMRVQWYYHQRIPRA